MTDNIRKVPNYNGRSTFDFILQQVEQCINDLHLFFQELTADQIYNAAYYEEILTVNRSRELIDVKELAHCDIAYCIVFFGVSKGDINILGRLFGNYYNPVFIQCILYYISRKPHIDSGGYQDWKSFRSQSIKAIVEKLKEDLIHKKSYFIFSPDISNGYDYSQALFQSGFYKYYGGHQFKLGHYYRHLFQTVKYIDNQTILTYSEKYEYMKTLRAQISTPEQYLLFFDSISSMGREWELKHLIDNKDCIEVNKLLITKYNLIKNIPDWYVFDRIDLRNYYPQVQFQSSAKNEKRREMKKKFN